MRRSQGILGLWYGRLRMLFGKAAVLDAPPPAQRIATAAAEAAQSNLEKALAFLQQGNLDEAEAIYRSLLQVQPHQSEALHFLGVVQAQRQNLTQAAELIGRALEIDPDNAAAHSNHGNVLKALKRNEDALASYDRALTLNPDSAEALNNRGTVLGELRRYDEALASYDISLLINPDYVGALLNRGISLAALGRNQEALVSYDRALAIDPGHADAVCNRSVVLSALGRHLEALAELDRALLVNPDHMTALNNRGVVLARMDRHAEALAVFDGVILSNPGSAEAFNCRGAVLAMMLRHEDALVSYCRAMEIAPEYAEALANRGGVFRELGRHEQAAQDFSRLVEIEPEYDYALGNKLHENMQICNWKQYQASRRQVVDAVRDGKRVGLPFSFLGMSDSGAKQLKCARIHIAHKYPVVAKPLWAGERYQHERIRIAYISADFRNHPLAHLMAELFEKHDKERFDVSAWSFGPDTEDEMRARLKNAFAQFNDVRCNSDIEVATMLRAREIDISVDLMGFTAGCRTAIFAQRAVPIQVNYIGYPGTMGADYMDYIIGDANVIPEGHEACYTEKVVRLPDAYQANDSKRVTSKRIPSRAEAKLPESGIVFCCFNNNFKITPDIFDVWMRLLKNVEGSVLWLYGENPAASRNLCWEAESRGVRADRLVFVARVPLPDHLARHRLADLFLDTLPYNAHTTASDALWMGLPVLTCKGNAFPGRVAASLLCAIGLPELITENLADYEALALKLATTPAMLNELKAKLARNLATQPLFDIDRFRRHIESAYSSMAERYQRGESPQSFSVPPIP